jgi:isohexenylglutaconyl-CoA hydratase
MSTSYQTIELKLEAPFALLTLNRPHVRNAMSFQMVDELIAAFEYLATLDDIRAVILTGAGDNFCAGGDLTELQAIPDASDAEQDARISRLDTLLRTVNQSPKVVIARVDGAALGGGLGLVCVSDIAIASTSTSFGLPEARLGLAPAIIAPYVIARVGLTRARLLMLTGARFDGVSAHEYGLVHEVCPPNILDECVSAILDEVRQCSPAALAACKQVIYASLTPDTLPDRARLFNTLRAGDDAQEGIRAFREQRPPNWA